MESKNNNKKDDSKSLSSQFWKEFAKGIVISNPVFILALGLCPTLAVTSSLDNALGMSAGVIFVLLCSNIIISIIRKATPAAARIPVFIVVIATFVTILSLVFQAYIPPLYESLGIYLALIVVNCIILGRAEVFASKNSVLLSIFELLLVLRNSEYGWVVLLARLPHAGLRKMGFLCWCLERRHIQKTRPVAAVFHKKRGTQSKESIRD